MKVFASSIVALQILGANASSCLVQSTIFQGFSVKKCDYDEIRVRVERTINHENKILKHGGQRYVSTEPGSNVCTGDYIAGVSRKSCLAAGLAVGGIGPLIRVNDPSLPGGCYLSSIKQIGYNRHESPSANDDYGNICRETCGTVDQEMYAIFKADNEQGLHLQIEETCNRARTAMEDNSRFEDIFDESFTGTPKARFYKEYYDGGTTLNENVNGERGTYNLAQETTPVLDFQRTKLNSGAVSWPDNAVTNFHTTGQGCELNGVMCCFIQDRRADDDGDCQTPYFGVGPTGGCVDKDPADNTDICYVDHTRSPTSSHVAGGFTIYDDAIDGGEGKSHCHGFAWANDLTHYTHRYRANNLAYVSFVDHVRNRGYVRNVPGAPMCGCLEQMPTVSRADCTEIVADEAFDFSYSSNSGISAVIIRAKIDFKACEVDSDDGDNNDLASFYRRLIREELIESTNNYGDFLVEQCAAPTLQFLDTKGITRLAN